MWEEKKKLKKIICLILVDPQIALLLYLSSGLPELAASRDQVTKQHKLKPFLYKAGQIFTDHKHDISESGQSGFHFSAPLWTTLP